MCAAGVRVQMELVLLVEAGDAGRRFAIRNVLRRVLGRDSDSRVGDEQLGNRVCAEFPCDISNIARRMRGQGGRRTTRRLLRY